MLPDRSFAELFATDLDAEAATHTRRRNIAERRAARRAPIEVDVLVVREPSSFFGLSVDIGPGGMFVATHRILDVGTSVTVELRLDDEVLRTEARVRWTRRSGDGIVPGLGLVFEELTAVDRDRIERYCAAHAPPAEDLRPAAS